MGHRLSGDPGFAFERKGEGALIARVRFHDAALRDRLNVSRFSHHLVGCEVTPIPLSTEAYDDPWALRIDAHPCGHQLAIEHVPLVEL